MFILYTCWLAVFLISPFGGLINLILSYLILNHCENFPIAENVAPL